MAIWVQCATCGKRYQAADHMAGRRVRCKQCGIVVELPLEPNAADQPFQSPKDAEGGPARGRGASRFDSVPAWVQPGPPVNDFDRPTPEIAPPIGDAPVGAEAQLEANPDVDQVFDEAFQEYRPERGNTLFVFPGSRTIDRYLPSVLAGGCVAWLAYMALGSGADELPWVGPVRLLVILMTYTGVIFPICLAGVRAAAQKLNAELPPGASWRAFATFLLPVTLGCVLWLSGGKVSGFLLGAALGFVVAMPAMWLLFRIRTEDALVSVRYAALAFGGGTLAGLALLAVLNLILVGVIRGTKSEHSLAMSPFGPSFAWDGPTTPPPPVAPANRPVLALKPDRGEPVAPTTKAFSDAPPGPAAGATTREAPATRIADLPPSPRPETAPAAEPAAETRLATAEAGFKSELSVGVTAVPEAQYGTVVAEVFSRFSGDMKAVVHPILPGQALAVVKGGQRGNEDSVELWSTRDWKARKGVTFASSTQGSEGYHLNADGSLLARLAAFPYVSTQVYSFVREELLRPPIKHDPLGTPPRLAGFCGPDQVLVLFVAGPHSVAEVWDVNSVRRLQQIPIPWLRADGGSYALSADGKLLAAIVRDDAGGDVDGRLEIYDLTTGKITRRIVIDELQWNASIRPSGLAFGEESDRVAMLFEHQGQGLFLAWEGPGDTPKHKHVYPGGMLPEGVDTGAFRGPPFDLLDGGRAWILYGTSVFDTRSGKLLGDLGVKRVRSQKVTSPDTLMLVQEGDGGGSVLLEVRLDVNRARRELAGKR